MVDQTAPSAASYDKDNAAALPCRQGQLLKNLKLVPAPHKQTSLWCVECCTAPGKTNTKHNCWSLKKQGWSCHNNEANACGQYPTIQDWVPRAAKVAQQDCAQQDPAPVPKATTRRETILGYIHVCWVRPLCHRPPRCARRDRPHSLQEGRKRE